MSNHAITGHKIGKWQYSIPLILVVVGTFMIPFSPMTNGLIAYTAIWALLYAPLRRQLAIIMSWPAFWFALAFIALMLVRLHSNLDLSMHAKLQQVWHYLALLLPTFLLIPLFANRAMRRPVRTAVAVSALLLGSIYLLNQYLPTHFSQLILTKLPPQQASTFLAIAAYILYATAHDKQISRAMRSVSAACVVYLGVVLLAVPDESVGLVLYVIGLLFFTYMHYSLKQCLYLLICMAAVAVLPSVVHHEWAHSSNIPTFKNVHRYLQKIDEQQTHPETAVGQHIFLTKKAVSHIAKKPIFGYGTGSFRSTDHNKVALGSIYHTTQNNYLQTAGQLGLAGLLLFLGFLISLWNMSFRLTGLDKSVLQGTIVLTMCAAVWFAIFATNATSMLFVVLVATSLGQLLDHN